jgi:hypothetical protein
VTVDAKGRVTGGSNITYLTTEGDSVVGNEVAGVVAAGGLVMTGGGTGVSPYRVGLITTCTDNQLLKYTSAGGWACANDIDTDTDTNTDAQTLTWNTGSNILTIGGGNTVDLTSLKDNTDSQALGLAGNMLSLTNGGSVSLAGYLDNTDSQALGLNSNLLSISGSAGTIDLSYLLDNTDSQSLSWVGGTRTLSLNGGGSVIIPDSDTTYSAGTGLNLTGNTFALTSTGVSAGSYNLVTVNGEGRVTSASNAGYLTSEGDGTVGNEISNVTAGSGLVRTGNGTSGDPYAVSLITTCSSSQLLKWNGTAWACANDTDK